MFNQDTFACEFGLLVNPELSRTRMNKEAAVLAQNIPTNNTTLLEHIKPSHHANPSFKKKDNEVALVPYIPAKDKKLVKYENIDTTHSARNMRTRT